MWRVAGSQELLGMRGRTPNGMVRMSESGRTAKFQGTRHKGLSCDGLHKGACFTPLKYQAKEFGRK